MHLDRTPAGKLHHQVQGSVKVSPRRKYHIWMLQFVGHIVLFSNLLKTHFAHHCVLIEKLWSEKKDSLQSQITSNSKMLQISLQLVFFFLIHFPPTKLFLAIFGSKVSLFELDYKNKLIYLLRWTCTFSAFIMHAWYIFNRTRWDCVIHIK